MLPPFIFLYFPFPKISPIDVGVIQFLIGQIIIEARAAMTVRHGRLYNPHVYSENRNREPIRKIEQYKNNHEI